jgi:hypothetical protein
MKKIIILLLCILSLHSVEAIAGKKEKKHKVKSTSVMQTVYENGKGTTYKESYEEFDKNGNTTLYNEFAKDGTITRKETYAYDKNNDLTEETLFDASSGKHSRKTHKYTLIRDKSREEEEDSFNEAGTLVKKTSFTYNASGKLASETVMDGSGKLLKKIIYNYNAKDLRNFKQTFTNSNTLEVAKEWHYEYY